MSVYCCFSGVNFTTYFFLRDKLPINMIMLVFFLAKCFRTAVKTMVVDKKKKTSSAIFGVEIAAKSCELKRCADRVPNRTDRANLNFSPELYRLIFSPKLNFSPSTKKRTDYSFELFFPLRNLFWLLLSLLVLYTTRVNMRFRAKNTGFNTGLYPVYATSYWWPCGAADGRTYGRTVTWLLRHYQNFLAW